MRNAGTNRTLALFYHGKAARAFDHSRWETSIRTFLVSLIGAAAVAAGLVVLRQQQKDPTAQVAVEVPPGESVPATIVLDRIRQAGI